MFFEGGKVDVSMSEDICIAIIVVEGDCNLFNVPSGYLGVSKNNDIPIFHG